MLSFESENGEDNGTGVDGREGVTGRNDIDVLHAVLVRRVVAAEADDGTESQTVRVEHLVGRVQPNRRVQQLVHLKRVRQEEIFK